MTKRIASDAPWESRYGYSRAVRAGSFIAVSGTTAADAGDAYAQTRASIAKIAQALEQAGASLRNVVRTRMYVTNIERDADAVGRAHAEAFGAVMPATSMVEVSRLIDSRMLVEIEADAIITADNDADP
jgi:enamine deaminase RidA (YjgF/YER057c/UK114 family)